MRCIFTLSKIWKKNIFLVFVYFLCDRWVEKTRKYSQNFLIANYWIAGAKGIRLKLAIPAKNAPVHGFWRILRVLTTAKLTLWSILVVPCPFFVCKQRFYCVCDVCCDLATSVDVSCLQLTQSHAWWSQFVDKSAWVDLRTAYWETWSRTDRSVEALWNFHSHQIDRWTERQRQSVHFPEKCAGPLEQQQEWRERVECWLHRISAADLCHGLLPYWRDCVHTTQSMTHQSPMARLLQDSSVWLNQSPCKEPTRCSPPRR